MQNSLNFTLNGIILYSFHCIDHLYNTLQCNYATNMDLYNNNILM